MPVRSKPLTLSPLARAALLASMALAATHTTQAADKVWNNGAGSSAWNTSHMNWSGSSWANAAGDGAIFSYTGIGPVALAGGMNASSLDFRASGYTLNGGVLNLVNGSSMAITSLDNTQVSGGVINVDPGVTARINSAINANVGVVKNGAGTLELAGPMTFNGAGYYYTNGSFGQQLHTDLMIAGLSSVSLGGTVKIMNSSVLPSSTRVGVGNGQLDIGNSNVTIGALTFLNQNDNFDYDPVTRASMVGSVVGNGTLRVNGDITVLGAAVGNNGANTIAANLDLGGGTQIVRVSSAGTFAVNRGLQFTGVLSNGSFLKTTGLTLNGAPGHTDGVGLYGNNTYTGDTILNGGVNVVTGTNQSGRVQITGSSAVSPGNVLILQGANGSYGAATLLQALAGGTLAIDNSAALAGVDVPTIAAANNNNRLNDAAKLQLRDGGFSYKGASNTASSETFGQLALAGGHNIVTLTPNGTGTVTVTANGGLTMADRSTLQLTATGLGGASKLFINGALPAADATGILRGAYVRNSSSSSDFLSYNATTGLTPLSAGAYASSFAAGAGANVVLAAASTLAASTSINALKTTGSFTTTIAAGQTLNVASGMVLNASGTAGYTGGTLDFGNQAGTFFGGTVNMASALTGTAGLINASSTLTLSGNLAGLSGVITNDLNGTTNLNTNSFAGGFEVRGSSLNVNVNQLGAGGAIVLGVKDNDANLMANVPTLALSGMGKDAVMARDIVVDNGSQSLAGMQQWYSMMPAISVLSNTTGSQTIAGNLVLNSPGRIQGGGASKTSTGATNFTGNVSGAAMLDVANGRVNFYGNVGNTGGLRIGESGFSADVGFLGTTSGSAPLQVMGGSATTVRYAAGALPTGLISVQMGQGNSAPVFVPLATSTINNTIVAERADIKANVGAGIVATWNGQVTTDASGYLVKQGAGTLVLNHGGSSAGAVMVDGGTLLINGGMGGAGVAVSSGATLGGSGHIDQEVLVNAGGTLVAAAGGGLSANKLTMAGGTLASSIDFASGAGMITLGDGGFSIAAGSSLQLDLANLPGPGFARSYLLVSNGGHEAINGAFASVNGLGALPAGYSWSVNYAFSGQDAFGRIGDGNDLALSIAAVPEPSTYAMFLAGGALMAWMRRRRAPQQQL